MSTASTTDSSAAAAAAAGASASSGETKPIKSAKRSSSKRSSKKKTSPEEYATIGRLAVRFFNKVVAASGLNTKPTKIVQAPAPKIVRDKTVVLKRGRFNRLKRRHYPAKPKSAYVLFMNKTRPELQAQHPDKSFGDLSRELSKAWKGLSKRNKLKFEKAAEESKEEYARAVEKYNGIIDANFKGNEAAYLASLDKEWREKRKALRAQQKKEEGEAESQDEQKQPAKSATASKKRRAASASSSSAASATSKRKKAPSTGRGRRATIRVKAEPVSDEEDDNDASAMDEGDDDDENDSSSESGADAESILDGIM